MKPLRITFVIVCLTMLYAFAPLSSAQAPTQNPSNSSNFEPSSYITVILDLTPKNPKPGEQVTAEILTTSFDIERTDIAWFENGELVQRGVGQKRHLFTASA